MGGLATPRISSASDCLVNLTYLWRQHEVNSPEAPGKNIIIIMPRQIF